MDGVRGVPVDQATMRSVTGDNNLKVSVKQPGQVEKLPGDDKTPPKPLDTVALTQALSTYSGGLKPGETVKIKMGKEEVATITKDGPSNWDRTFKAVRQVGAKVMDVTKEAIEIDPSFVFRETVEMAKDPLTQMAPEAIKELSLKGLYPGVRAGVLFLDIRKAWKTLKDPKSTLADKVVDIGHCITDVGGLIGAAAPLVGLAIPGAQIFVATAIVGDIIAFAYHTLMYVLRKGEGVAGPAGNKPQQSNVKPPVEPQKPDENTKESKKT